MRATKQNLRTDGYLFILLWLVFAVSNTFFPQNLPSPVEAALSITTLLGYILMAGSFSRVLIDTALIFPGRAKGGFVVCVCLLVLLYLGHNRFGGSLLFSLLQSIILLVGSTFLGAFLSSAINRIGELLPLALTAVTADIVSVFHGPTKGMGEQLTAYYGGGMQGIPPLVDLFLLKGAGQNWVIQPLFGVSDWVLIILLSSSILRLGKTDNLLGEFLFFPVTAAGLFLSMLVAGFLQLYVPALFFICLFFLIFLVLRCRLLSNLQPRDLIYSIVFPTVVGTLILVLAG
jgi:hypothetical protein